MRVIDIFRKKCSIYLILLTLVISFIFPAAAVQFSKEEINNLYLKINDDPPIGPSYTKETYMVPMRDEIKLATDVYLPDEIDSTSGSILIRTPYNKNDMNMGDWADSGWPTSVQDMRGRYASEGIDTVFRNAHTDGPDTLKWIAQQDWSNGKVCTFGGSALGINQYYMAGADPANLACQYIQVATPNLYKHAMFQGGQFRSAMVEGWLQGQGSLFVLPELLEHENYTLDYWTNVSLEDNWQDVNVPAIHIGGWYDCFAQGTVEGFMGYQYLGGRGARGFSKLIMGPWVHGASRISGELIYPENAMPDFPFELFVDMIYKFCEDEDYDGPVDFDSWPAVSYYTMSDPTIIDSPANEWRFADSWPITDEYVEWFLHEDGELCKELPVDYDPLSYSYDPDDPVPTVGGQNLNLPSGPYDQSEVENRDDVLVFTSEALHEPYEATGPISARLYISSNCPDTDFTVKLSDVYPDGRSMLITDGILRARNREGFDHWEFMQEGEVYEILVDLWSTSYVWNTGHKIRVAISSSNYPRFLNNPNTDDAVYSNTETVIAENTIYLDNEHPSCLLLPEITYPDNYPPDKPSKAQGETNGRYNQKYTYTTLVTDPDGDDIYVIFNWGDGRNTGWIGPYLSGEQISMDHTYMGLSEKSFEITLKAKDINGEQSEWSDPLTVTMPRNRDIRIFAILSRLIGLIGNIEIFSKILNF